MRSVEHTYALQRPVKCTSHVIFSQHVDVTIREIRAGEDSDGTAGFVWPASRLLAHFLQTVPANEESAASICPALRCFQGKRVLELGGGTGVLGIALGAIGASVTITDVPEAVPHIQANIERNSVLWENPQACRPVSRPHAWGEDTEWLSACAFDYVIGADLLYFGGWDLFGQDSREPLLQTLAAAASSSSHAVLGWPVRHPEREGDFLSKASRRFNLRLHTGHGEGDEEINWKWSEVWRGIAPGGDITSAQYAALLHEGAFACLELSTCGGAAERKR